jgi:hypothetical protein
MSAEQSLGTLRSNPRAETQRRSPLPFLARKTYLDALQSLWPEFWRELRNGVLVAVCHSDSDSDFPQFMVDFTRRYHVREIWMFDAIKETLNEWSRHPLGPAFRLDKDARWWRYQEADSVMAENMVVALLEQQKQLVFPRMESSWSPVLERELWRGEISTSEFRERDDRRFEQKLEAVNRECRAIHKRKQEERVALLREFGLIGTSLMERNAQFTVLSRRGLSYADIADKWEIDMKKTIEEETVRMACRNFEKFVGLAQINRKKRRRK